MTEEDDAIYVPPRDGLPYLVVTMSSDGFAAQPVNTRTEARTLLSRVRLQKARERSRVGVERTSKP